MKYVLLVLILIGGLPSGFAQEDQDPVVVCNQTLSEQNAALIHRACSIVAELADAQLYRTQIEFAHTEDREGSVSDEQLQTHQSTVDNIRRYRLIANFKRLIIIPEPHQRCWLSRKVLLDAKHVDLTGAHSGLADAVETAQSLSDQCEAEYHSRALLDETEFTASDGSEIRLNDVIGWSYSACLTPSPANPYQTLTACRELQRLLLPWHEIQVEVQKAFPDVESIAERTAQLREDLGILHARRMQILSVVSRADIPAICQNAEVALLFFGDGDVPNYDVDWVRDAFRDARNKNSDCLRATAAPSP